MSYLKAALLIAVTCAICSLYAKKEHFVSEIFEGLAYVFLVVPIATSLPEPTQKESK